MFKFKVSAAITSWQMWDLTALHATHVAITSLSGNVSSAYVEKFVDVDE